MTKKDKDSASETAKLVAKNVGIKSADAANKVTVQYWILAHYYKAC